MTKIASFMTLILNVIAGKLFPLSLTLRTNKLECLQPDRLEPYSSATQKKALDDVDTSPMFRKRSRRNLNRRKSW